MADVLTVPVLHGPATDNGESWVDRIVARLGALSSSIRRSLYFAPGASARLDQAKWRIQADAMKSVGYAL